MARRRIIMAIIILLVAASTLYGIKYNDYAGESIGGEPVKATAKPNSTTISFRDLDKLGYISIDEYKLIYTTPPPMDLYNEIYSSAMDGLRYVEASGYSNWSDYVSSNLEKAQRLLANATHESWDGFLKLSAAKFYIARAAAFVNASKGILDGDDITRIHGSLVSQLAAAARDTGRYRGTSIDAAITAAYPAERHLFKAYNWLNQTMQLLNMPRGMDYRVGVADAYGSLEAARIHMEIAGYISSTIDGSDYSREIMEASRLALVYAESLAGYMEREAGGEYYLTMMIRDGYLKSARDAYSSGLYVYSLVYNLIVYLIVESYKIDQFRDPWFDKGWSAPAGEIYRVREALASRLDGVLAGSLSGIERVLLFEIYRNHVAYTESLRVSASIYFKERIQYLNMTEEDYSLTNLPKLVYLHYTLSSRMIELMPSAEGFLYSLLRQAGRVG